jgi:hypothetical protein
MGERGKAKKQGFLTSFGMTWSVERIELRRVGESLRVERPELRVWCALPCCGCDGVGWDCFLFLLGLGTLTADCKECTCDGKASGLKASGLKA